MLLLRVKMTAALWGQRSVQKKGAGLCAFFRIQYSNNLASSLASSLAYRLGSKRVAS